MPSFTTYHVPTNLDSCTCGEPFLSHRVDHACEGDPCRQCGLPRNNHRKRAPRKDDRIGRLRRGTRDGYDNRPSHEPYGDPCTRCGRPSSEHRGTDSQRHCYIGIDGEGADLGGTSKKRGTHQYVMLCASDEIGDREWEVTPHPGKTRLTTEQCLDMILELPTRHARIFSFAFNYDITMMLTDCDDETIYRLMRPNLRQRFGPDAVKGPKPEPWPRNSPNPYLLNLQGTKFTVKRDGKKVVIWDLFKFFQAKFVSAIKDWKVGHQELWDRMEEMKSKRAIFREIYERNPLSIRKYCFEETRCMAQLGRKLVESHETAGLQLRSFYGAGSSGAAMLTAMGIKGKNIETPAFMRKAVASGFSGGRFENHGIGLFRMHLANFDISSAYPYQLTFLPCLEHGTWEHTTRRKDLEKAENQNGALIRYKLGRFPHSVVDDSWGPFPFREKDGNISYPLESGGGWVWRQEYLEGEKLFPNVQFVEAWVYTSNCGCRPFAQIPEYYCLRCKLGKEGPGIVIKLGCNSCYGKLAQSVGSAQFNQWIWAGMITSGTRAQLLNLLGLHRNRSDVLMMATDGLLTKDVTVIPPEPLPTGTAQTGKPLGGWERKEATRGMFLARPGIYFPLNPTKEELTAIRARGVGRGVVLESWRKIVDVWKKEGVNGKAVVANVSRFCGAKTSVSIKRDGSFHRAKPGRINRKTGAPLPAYGQWVERLVDLSFNPHPKRAGINPDGKTLRCRKMPLTQESEPYDAALHSRHEEALKLKAAMQEMLEQPNSDFTYGDVQGIAEMIAG